MAPVTLNTSKNSEILKQATYEKLIIMDIFLLFSMIDSEALGHVVDNERIMYE